MILFVKNKYPSDVYINLLPQELDAMSIISLHYTMVTSGWSG